MTRVFLLAVLVALSFPAASQSAARPRPPGTTPLEEPPPPPLLSETDPSLEPQVSVRTEEEQTVHEYRVKGKLYMQRVTPKHGRPYLLMDYNGDGTFVRSDHPTDIGVRVPQWVLKEF